MKKNNLKNKNKIKVINIFLIYIFIRKDWEIKKEKQKIWFRSNLKNWLNTIKLKLKLVWRFLYQEKQKKSWFRSS